uniref:MYG1 exonuclease n=1 Tax=Canis lupus familiaris TaxID=9615 RepID=A0A8I3P0P9_CANLF
MGRGFPRALLPRLLRPPPPARPGPRMLRAEPVPPPKRPRGGLMAPARIGTHDGTFHCDEALACALLRLLPEYRDAEIVRTRDPEKLAACDVVVDVGGEYDPQRHRYDHHQRSFTETMSSLSPGKRWQTKLSSAGLVYLHFGHKLLAQLLGTSEEDSMVGTIYDKMYENFVEEVDAVDNGISQWEEGEPRYVLTTTLSARVARLNPTWNQPNQDTEAGFQRAMDLVREEFLQRVDFYQHSWLPARALVQEALAQRFQVDPSGEIVELAKGGCPWKEHLYHLESGLSPPVTVAFVIYTDQAGQWRVQCVPKEPHSFQSRLPLPEPWRGLRDGGPGPGSPWVRWCLLRWSLRVKRLEHSRQVNFFSRVCVRTWRSSSSERVKRLPQKSQLHTKGRSPVCQRRCAFRCEALPYTLPQPGMWQLWMGFLRSPAAAAPRRSSSWQLGQSQEERPAPPPPKPPPPAPAPRGALAAPPPSSGPLLLTALGL